MNAAAGAWGRPQQQDFRSRVRGCLLGGAVGDTLGAGIADDSLEEIRERYGPQGVADLVPAYGRRGAVTAGTQTALFTVDGLIRAQIRRDSGAWHPPTDLHAAYRRWYATQRDWGPDERKDGDGWLAREEWLYSRRAPDKASMTGLGDERMGTLTEPRDPDADGSGALLRSAPFGLLVGWEPQLVFQLAAECAVQTHGHPSGFLAAGAFAVVVHGLARGEAVDTAVQRAMALLAERPGHEEVSQALHAALIAGRQGTHGAETVEGLGEGRTAAEALAAGLYCAVAAEALAANGAGVRQALLLAVNHGGDSAATGALAGHLLGARHGETALPPAWVAEVEGRGTILELADDFAMEMTQGPALHGPAGDAPGWLGRYPRG